MPTMIARIVATVTSCRVVTMAPLSSLVTVWLMPQSTPRLQLPTVHPATPLSQVK